MAKEKKNETNEAVLQYLQMQNRPFSINDLLQNATLKELGKAAVQKALDQLVVVCIFNCFGFCMPQNPCILG